MPVGVQGESLEVRYDVVSFKRLDAPGLVYKDITEVGALNAPKPAQFRIDVNSGLVHSDRVLLVDEVKNAIVCRRGLVAVALKNVLHGAFGEMRDTCKTLCFGDTVQPKMRETL